jgi:hypothetical protein
MFYGGERSYIARMDGEMGMAIFVDVCRDTSRRSNNVLIFSMYISDPILVPYEIRYCDPEVLLGENLQIFHLLLTLTDSVMLSTT